KGIRVISIAADHDENVFEYHAKDFPWTDKLCDYQGFEGNNFKNYGVVATPTIYLIDENGNIQGKFATLQETGLPGDE
ncbi:MAG: thioredoxin family protein, partial [Candidatus Azobacteroides sp.]|nr:thioredoxin family protein [Candidatus Azobacteroides sp.]